MQKKVLGFFNLFGNDIVYAKIVLHKSEIAEIHFYKNTYNTYNYYKNVSIFEENINIILSREIWLLRNTYLPLILLLICSITYWLISVSRSSTGFLPTYEPKLLKFLYTLNSLFAFVYFCDVQLQSLQPFSVLIIIFYDVWFFFHNFWPITLCIYQKIWKIVFNLLLIWKFLTYS